MTAVTLEQVVSVLASQCDGARRRDGRGFSRADASEGARLSAMASAGIAWSGEDARRALEMAARHPMQAAEILAGGDKARVAALAGALRAGKVPTGTTPVEEGRQGAYNLASRSPGGKLAYLWRMSWIDDLGSLSSGLRELSRMRHGARRIRVREEKSAEITMNGKRRRLPRWEVDLNGTSAPAIVALARKHGFALDPALGNVDGEIDALRRSERAAWLMEGVRDGVKGVWLVMDLDAPCPEFSAAMKSSLRGRYRCDPSEDWNWFVAWSPANRTAARAILSRFGFACSRDVAAD